jgi:ribosome-binding factor A
MASRRVQKAAEAIREVVSMAILAEMKDPRVSDVTVTQVELSADLRQAKVYVSIMGDDKKQRLCLHGLQNATGFLQSKVARRLDTRYTPRLSFVLDMGVKKSLEIHRILQEVLPKRDEDSATALDEPADEFDADDMDVHDKEADDMGDADEPSASSAAGTGAEEETE